MLRLSRQPSNPTYHSNNTMNPFLRFLLATTSAFILAGCAGYVMGPHKPAHLADFETIGVPMAVNKTLEPRIESLVTNTIIKQLQQDGTFKVADYKSADLLLEVEVVDIERRRARSVRNNVQASREFNLYLRLKYNLVERATGRQIVAGREVSGDTSFFVGEDLQQDERQALSLAAEMAAVRLVVQISEGGAW